MPLSCTMYIVPGEYRLQRQQQRQQYFSNGNGTSICSSLYFTGTLSSWERLAIFGAAMLSELGTPEQLCSKTIHKGIQLSRTYFQWRKMAGRIRKLIVNSYYRGTSSGPNCGKASHSSCSWTICRMCVYLHAATSPMATKASRECDEKERNWNGGNLHPNPSFISFTVQVWNVNWKVKLIRCKCSTDYLHDLARNSFRGRCPMILCNRKWMFDALATLSHQLHLFCLCLNDKS